jgi:hypothetical protein
MDEHQLQLENASAKETLETTAFFAGVSRKHRSHNPDDAAVRRGALELVDEMIVTLAYHFGIEVAEPNIDDDALYLLY